MKDSGQTSTAGVIFAKVAQGFLHVFGTLSIATLFVLPGMNRIAAAAIWDSARHPEFVALSWSEVLLHLGLSAALWTLSVLLFKVARGKRKPVKKVLALRTGSVITETLIIMPFFLLLTFGIAQLALNNMAGLLANTAVFQAGRTAWLWSSEADANRRGVNDSKVEELARVQASAVLTPVAPGEFMQAPLGASDEFKDMRGILLGSQMPALSQDTGAMARPAANAYLLGGDAATAQSGQDSSFIRAFGLSNFRERTVKKFTFAYQATEVEVERQGEQVQTELTYRHHQAMPMVGSIFADNSILQVAGRQGYYAPIERSFSMEAQIPPNPEMP
ncbi:MAG: TadE family protein [Persicimonas sp.]